MSKKQSIDAIYRASIDADSAARGLCIPKEQFLKQMDDGRTLSRWGEIWTTVVYQMTLAPVDTRAVDSFGSRESGYSTKSLTKRGTGVGLSSNTGKGRTSTTQDVDKAIDAVVAYNFVDNTSLPKLDFIQVRSVIISKWLRDGHIGKDGRLSYKKFYELLGPRPIYGVDLITGEILDEIKS